jgi:hypothetical protein
MLRSRNHPIPDDARATRRAVKYLKKTHLSPIVFDGLHLPAVDGVNGIGFVKESNQ